MKQCAAGVAAFFVIACGQSDLEDYEIVSSSVVTTLAPEFELSPECELVGTVIVEAREVSFIDRLSGSSIEDFSRSQLAQVAALGANTLLPVAGSDSLASARSGARYEAKAYRCP